MSQGRSSINELFAKLNIGKIDSSTGQKLVALKNALLDNPNDAIARQELVATLIEIDRIGEAYTVLRSLGVKESFSRFPEETAYVCYRLNHLEELGDLSSLDSTRSLQHILAQARYKKEEPAETEKIYSSILNKGKEEVIGEFSDIKVNLSAVTAHNALNDQVVKISSWQLSEEDSHDQLFNYASACIGTGDVYSAFDYLRKTKLACENSSLSPEEVANELVPIQVQAAFVSEILGDHSEALNILESVDIYNIQDSLVRLVALNNYATLGEPENSPHLTAKKLSLEQNWEGVTDRATGYQKNILESNRLLLWHLAGRNISKQAAKLRNRYPNVIGIEASAIYSTLGLDEMDNAQQIKVLKSYVKEHKDSLAANILFAQLLSKAGKYDSAGTVLESVLKILKHVKSEVQYYPGLIAAVVNILKIQNRISSVPDIISDALEHWKSRSKCLSKSLAIPLFELAISESEPLRKAAEEFYHDVLKIDASLLVATAGLVSTGPSEGVSGLEGTLPNIGSLVDKIDAESLNSFGINPLLRTYSEDYSQMSHTSTKRRKTKSKLPQNYDPAKQPDPERWLAKRDRSTYKPKRKDKKNALKSTQGSSTQDIEFSPSHTTVVQSKQKNKKKSRR